MQVCSNPVSNLMSILMLPAGSYEINTLQLIDTNILTKVWGDMPNNKTDFPPLRRNFRL